MPWGGSWGAMMCLRLLQGGDHYGHGWLAVRVQDVIIRTTRQIEEYCGIALCPVNTKTGAAARSRQSLLTHH